MSKRTIFCFLFLSAARFVFAQPTLTASPDPSPNPVLVPPASVNPIRDLENELDQAGLQRVIEKLQSSYVDSGALTNQEINQAAVEGLLSRLGPGASLQTKAQIEKPAPVRPFKSEFIQTQFGYVRLGSFTQSGLPQLDETLN